MKRILLSPAAADGTGTGQGAQGAGAGAGGDQGQGGGGDQGQGQGGASGARNAPPGSDLFKDDPEPGGQGQGQEQGNQGGDKGTGGDGGAATGGTGTTGLSRDDIQQILASVMPQAVAAGAAQAQPRTEMSPEEFARTFNVFQPDEALIAAIKGDDPMKAQAAIVRLRDGLIRQAMTMAEYRIQQHVEKLNNGFREQLTPLQSYYQEQQARSFREDFFKANPDLEKYEVIVDAVAAKLQAAGWTGKDRKEVMAKFAADTKEVVKALLAQGGGQGQPANGQPPANGQQKGKMAQLSDGGQGGRGGGGQGGGQGAAKGPPGIEVFE